MIPVGHYERTSATEPTKPLSATLFRFHWTNSWWLLYEDGFKMDTHYKAYGGPMGYRKAVMKTIVTDKNSQ